MILQYSESFSSFTSSATTKIDHSCENVSSLRDVKGKKATDMDINVMHCYYYGRSDTIIHLLDVSEAVNMIMSRSIGTSDNILSLMTINWEMDKTTTKEVKTLIHAHVNVGQSYFYVNIYLARASSGLHYWVITEISNAFISWLLEFIIL